MFDVVILWVHIIILLVGGYHIRLSVRHMEAIAHAIQHLAEARIEIRTTMADMLNSLDNRVNQLLFTLEKTLSLLTEQFPLLRESKPRVELTAST